MHTYVPQHENLDNDSIFHEINEKTVRLKGCIIHICCFEDVRKEIAVVITRYTFITKCWIIRIYSLKNFEENN